jgi:hypothetical protein
MFEYVVEGPGDLMRGGTNRLLAAEPCLHPAIEGPEDNVSGSGVETD